MGLKPQKIQVIIYIVRYNFKTIVCIMIGMVLAIMRFVEEKLVKALSKNPERY